MHIVVPCLVFYLILLLTGFVLLNRSTSIDSKTRCQARTVLIELCVSWVIEALVVAILYVYFDWVW